MATFITTKPVGSTISMYIQVTGGSFQIKRGDVIGPVTQSGNVSFTITEPIGHPSREFTIILVSAGGGQVPRIEQLTLNNNCGISQFDGNGLVFNNTATSTLNLSNNPLTTFNGEGITDLARLQLENCQQLITFNGTGLSSIRNIYFGSTDYLQTFIAGGDKPLMKELFLNHKQLTSFDGNGLIALETLRLYNNRLTSFDGTGLTNLKELSLSGNKLTSFNGTGLSSLETLFLQDNQLPLTSFNGNGLSNLKNLYLQNSKLTSFAGTGLSSLLALYLNGNNLTSFDVNGLTNLKELYLNNAQLTSFAGTGLSSLQTLSLQSNQLTSFAGTGLSSLQNLYLQNNPITSLNLNGCSILQVLVLLNNQLTSFAGTGLSSLQTLVLQNNPLTSLNLNGCSSLQNLNLNNTQLTSFDGTGLTNLRGLTINHSQLTGLTNLSGCSSLQYLESAYNQLTSFAGTGLSSLGNLQLGNNQLTSFDGNGLSGLVELDLGNNHLTTFTGLGLSNLTILYLYNNQLTSFDGTGLSSLTYLKLTGSQLISFNGSDLTSLTSLEGFDSSNISSFTANESIIQFFIDSLPSAPNIGNDKNKYEGLEQIKNEVKSTFEQRINAKSNIIKNLTKLKLLLSRIEEKPTDVGTINEYYYLLVDTTEIFNNAAPLYFTTELYLWKETLQNEKDLWDSMEGNNVNYGQAYYDFIINILNSNYVNEFRVGYELYNNLKAAWNTLSVEYYRLLTHFTNSSHPDANQEFIYRMQVSIRDAYGAAINKYAYFKLASDLSNGPWKAEAGIQFINLLKSATSNQEKIDEIDTKANSVINFFDNQSSYLSYKATLLSQFLTDFENVVIQMSYDTDALHTHAKEKGVKSIHPLKFVLNVIKFQILNDFQVLNDIGDEPNSRTMGIFKELVDNGSWTVEQVNDFYGWLSSNISKFNTISEGALNALSQRKYSVPLTWSIVNHMDYRNFAAKFGLVEKEIEYYNELLSQYPTAILGLQNEISGMESEIYTLEIEKSELEVNNDTENPRYTEVNGLISGLISDIQERNGIITEKEVLITVETQLRDMLISDSLGYNGFKNSLNSFLEFSFSYKDTALNMYDDIYDILTEFDGKTMPQYFNLDGIV